MHHKATVQRFLTRKIAVYVALVGLAPRPFARAGIPGRSRMPVNFLQEYAMQVRCSSRASQVLLLSAAVAALALVGCSEDDGGDASPTPETPEPSLSPSPSPAPGEVDLTVHYYRPAADYDGWQLMATGDVEQGGPIDASETDAFGAVFPIDLTDGAQSITLSVGKGGAKDPADLVVDLSRVPGAELWVYSGSDAAFTEAPQIPVADTAIVYYVRGDGDYSGWGLHVWSDDGQTDVTDAPEWDTPLQIAGVDAFGAYWIVHLGEAADSVNFIIHKGDLKDPGPDQRFEFATKGHRIWRLQEDPTIFTHPVFATTEVKLDGVRAHWVSEDTLAWDVSGDSVEIGSRRYTLHYAAAGGIAVEDGVVSGGQSLELSWEPAGLSSAITSRFPQLAGYEAFTIGAGDLAKVPDALKGQLVVSSSDSSGTLLAATGLQIPGVLDDLYAYEGPLGVTWNGAVPTLSVWAPTAKSVTFLLFDSSSAETESQELAMTHANGVWSITGDSSWKNLYYLYDVEVYVSGTGRVEHNRVTDPYSISLAANSTRSQIVDLNDPALLPAGWTDLVKADLQAPEDIALYELHVRDFSMSDETTSELARGTFMAFTEFASDGMHHLSALADGGLTHIHLLPSFDFATVAERRADQEIPEGDLSQFDPDGEEQQAAVGAVKDSDGFNWGYDPYHFTVPEGSYSTDPDGAARILEFRAMVQGLADVGLRVVMDVVYNHTTASGQNEKSVLDRVVPGYYHRLDDRGNVATSSCCQNTATEHVMMEKLMIDSLVTWATAYKVDGFRFDLMGHHMKSNMIKARDTLQALTPAEDGVDGSRIYLYGEGWDFGEVANNARGVNATQLNMAGTGIGTFNDRIRDAVRGGGPFDSGEDLKKQGFISGLFYDPNALEQGSETAQEERLLQLMDQIRVGLTGNLADYELENYKGLMVSGSEIDYNGQPAGYTQDPQEVINYVSAHDNQTLFDALAYKLPQETPLDERVRAQNLGMDIVALGQGIRFFHAGIDMLRSKSLDRDSYNSGDWFNTLDFSYAHNNWGVGLPPEGVNGDNWDIMRPLLADPDLVPAEEDILEAVAHFQEVLSIRNSSPLFRLTSEADVMARLAFYNTGVDQIPGLIVMALSDDVDGLPDLDPIYETVVVLFNASSDTVEFNEPTLSSAVLDLHPRQRFSADPVVSGSSFLDGTFSIPPRTTAVFVSGPEL